ncbi:FKBP-type peptidyl-prolyl cis-trans isomerase [Patescibacteria group bacterium]|nr:FKBP-type peptidyl-prolyl cis-trans isomerase [Patescibacteria group bacterium]
MPKQSFDPTKLNIEDIKIGGGEEAKNGDTVQVHYTGTLIDGTKFDSSLDRNQPFSFTIGAGQVIQGWELGVVGMKIGGKRKLTIPASLGYGASGVPGTIPQNAVLIFEIELLKKL